MHFSFQLPFEDILVFMLALQLQKRLLNEAFKKVVKDELKKIKFLDDLNLSKLSDLPELPEIQNIPEEAQISLLNEPSSSNPE